MAGPMPARSGRRVPSSALGFGKSSPPGAGPGPGVEADVSGRKPTRPISMNSARIIPARLPRRLRNRTHDCARPTPRAKFRLAGLPSNHRRRPVIDLLQRETEVVSTPGRTKNNLLCACLGCSRHRNPCRTTSLPALQGPSRVKDSDFSGPISAPLAANPTPRHWGALLGKAQSAAGSHCVYNGHTPPSLSGGSYLARRSKRSVGQYIRELSLHGPLQVRSVVDAAEAAMGAWGSTAHTSACLPPPCPAPVSAMGAPSRKAPSGRASLLRGRACASEQVCAHASSGSRAQTQQERQRQGGRMPRPHLVPCVHVRNHRAEPSNSETTRGHRGRPEFGEHINGVSGRRLRSGLPAAPKLHNFRGGRDPEEPMASCCMPIRRLAHLRGGRPPGAASHLGSTSWLRCLLQNSNDTTRNERKTKCPAHGSKRHP